MLNETFYINGTDMRTLGVYLQRPIRISGLVPIVEKVHVEGRNGDLIFPTGAYENREGRADCFALSPTGDVGAVITAVNALLMKSQGYVELKQSEDPTHFWKARITNGADIEQRLRTLNPFTIKFDIEPQHWRVDGLEKITFTETYGNHKNPGTGDAKPLFLLYGYSWVDIQTKLGTPNRTLFQMDLKQMKAPCYVDCETVNAYNADGNQNNKVGFQDNIVPIIHSGIYTIGWNKATMTKIEMIPRWWDL